MHENNEERKNWTHVPQKITWDIIFQIHNCVDNLNNINRENIQHMVYFSLNKQLLKIFGIQNFESMKRKSYGDSQK